MQRYHIFRPFILLLIVVIVISFSNPSTSVHADSPALPTSEHSVSSSASTRSEAFRLAASTPAPATCLLYAVNQHGRSDSQLFTINLRSSATSPLGTLLAGYDIEGLAIHPATRILYTTSGERSVQPGQLFMVDSQSGALTPIGSTGFNDVTGLAFRPTDATLWGWAEGVGLIQIDTMTGAGALKFAATKEMDGLAWKNDGSLLYTATSDDLWAYNPGDNTLKKIAANLPGDTEALAIRPDDLVIGARRVEDAVNVFAYDANARKVVWSKRIASSYDDIEALAWPAACGNPSPGGKAKMIKEVTLEKRQVCPGENFMVSVRTEHPEAPQNTVDVAINGNWGNSQYLQFTGVPGPRLIQITATTAEKYIDSRQVKIEVVACDPARRFPVVYVRPNLYHDLTIDFEIANAAELNLQNPTYTWDFGDGQVGQTTVPFTSHYYGDAINQDRLYAMFQTTISAHQDGMADISTHKTITLWNEYAFSKQRGIIQPPTTVSGNIQSIGDNLVGTYTIQNLEDAPVQFTSQQLEYQFCDPDRDSTLLAPQGISLEIGGKQTATQQIQIPADSLSNDVCGLAIHLRGQVSNKLSAFASAYFELRENMRMRVQVRDSAQSALLNQIVDQKLLGEVDRITDEDLYRLAREGKISFPLPSTPAATTQAALLAPQAGPPAEPPADVIGQTCRPGDTPPRPGVACLVTQEWGYTPAYIANAKKGDILLVANCGSIGQLLRHLSPRQYYSHEGIMTRDRYEVRHSTASEGRYRSYRVGIGGSGGIRPDILKYGWPGTITQPIYKAFEGEYFADPEGGQPYLIHGFSHDTKPCDGDTPLSPPLVIKPPLSDEAAVRPKLHAAADVAKDLNGHYRFFGYSQGAIALDPTYTAPPESGWANGTRATVSSVFIWAALKDAGITLEGGYDSNQDAKDYAQGGDIDCRPMDGLYCYTEAERLEAGKWLYADTYNKAYEQAGVVGNALTHAADKFAQQLANCFAFDLCDTLTRPQPGDIVTPTNRDRWRHPGPGQSVSPDNFKFWDAPPTGVYGFWENMIYQMGAYQRVYRWAPSSGTGTVTGQVTHDGAPVEAATVTLAGITLLTNADGRFTFEAIPAGPYLIRAIKEIAPPEGGSPLLAIAQADVTAVADATSTVDLPLSFVPPAQPKVTVRVTIEHVKSFGCTGTYVWPGACIGSETPDFYAKVKVDERGSDNRDQYISDQSEIFPNWNLPPDPAEVDPSKANIPISIEVWDYDDTLHFDDDQIDVNPHKGRTLNLLLDLSTCQISGDATGNCGATIYSKAGQDGHEDLAEIWFRIDK